jgi:uncharacterized Ntn-hydrolase superfamily protein
VTFSIVAWDPSPDSGPEWGVAVASKFLAVGSAVPWVQADAGGVATQALANLGYGPDGLALLATGKTADQVVEELTSADADRDHRQLGVVDSRGGAATFTGAECLDWAGGRTGEGFCCQGNILTGPDVVDRMVEAFKGSSGELAYRLLAAMDAGDAAGGDRRGRQSAAVYVAREGGGYGGTIDRAIDLRVDEHPAPLPELRRLLDYHRLLIPRPEDLDFLPIDDDMAARLRRGLVSKGYEAGTGVGYDDTLRKALYDYVGTENLEERWTDDPKVDRGIVEYLEKG